MAHSAADRNLLVGVIALRMNFATKEQVIACMHGWFADRTQRFSEILRNRGFIDATTQSMLENLADHQLQLHHGDAQESISAISASDISGLEAFGIGTTTDAPDLSELTASLNGRFDDDPSSRYRVLRKYAEGGLCDVFVAEDTELHREVALKEIKRQHAGNADSRERFTLEAELTGGLEHPGVVPVYGFGCYADGRPYYAMRLIKGDTLKAAIKQYHEMTGDRALALRGLLTRFVAVCQAIAYAHSRGVVHRDLKPSNIMLAKFGETLVVDWGLAKAVGRDKKSSPALTATAELTFRPGSGSAVVTEAGKIIGTPAYMSPEQARGQLDDLCPASDVYSLGSTLYNLLVGVAPFDGPVDSVLEKVQRGEFPPPRQRQPHLAPALEAICLRAMALTPDQRYATASDLAADIEQWLADEPVQAWREPWGTRAWRWVRRHRTAVVGTGVLLATATVGLGISTALIYQEQMHTAQQKHAAELQWTRAEENLKLARATTSSLFEVAEKRLPANSQTLAVRREIMDAAANIFRRFLEQRPDDRDMQVLAARALRYSGNAHRVAQDYKVAVQLCGESIELLQRAWTVGPVDDEIGDELAETLRDQASVLAALGQLKLASAALTRSLQLGDDLRNRHPQRMAYSRTAALAALDLSSLDYTSGRHVDSARHSARAVTLSRAVIQSGQDPHSLDALFVGAGLNRQAVAERELDHVNTAIALHREALQFLSTEVRQRPENLTYQHGLHRVAVDFASTVTARPDHHEDVMNKLDVAIVFWQKLKNQSPNPSFAEWYVRARLAMAEIALVQQDWLKATQNLAEAAAVLEKINADSLEVEFMRGQVHWARARLARHQGHAEAIEAAVILARKALTGVISGAPDHYLATRLLAAVNRPAPPR